MGFLTIGVGLVCYTLGVLVPPSKMMSLAEQVMAKVKARK